MSELKNPQTNAILNRANIKQDLFCKMKIYESWSLFSHYDTLARIKKLTISYFIIKCVIIAILPIDDLFIMHQ